MSQLNNCGFHEKKNDQDQQRDFLIQEKIIEIFAFVIF